MSGMFESLISLADLQGLINSGTRESEVLEYKTATDAFTDRDKPEIAKDISAMANSLGGVVIYGISTKRSDKTLPERIVPIHLSNIETLERVVNAQVRPVVQGLRKKVIPTLDPQVMVVEVPASDDPPHQCLYDKKYYRRSSSENLPMEHDLVALKFGRKLFPLLDVDIQVLSKPSQMSGDPAWTDECDLRILIRNAGRRIARYIQLILKFPPSELVRIADVMQTTSSINRLYPGIQARQFTDNAGVVHPGMSLSIIELRFSFSQVYISDPQHALLEWSVVADEMTSRSGTARLADVGWATLTPRDG